MKANVTIDAGKGIVEAVGSLAQSIGTTVDGLFPAYVKQAVVQAKASIFYDILVIVALIIGAVIAFGLMRYCGQKKKERASRDDDTWEGFQVAFGAGLVMLCIVLAIWIVAFLSTMPEYLATIQAPEPAAVKAMTKDLAQLLHGGQ